MAARPGLEYAISRAAVCDAPQVPTAIRATPTLRTTTSFDAMSPVCGAARIDPADLLGKRPAAWSSQKRRLPAEVTVSLAPVEIERKGLAVNEILNP